MSYYEEPICALATPPGQSALAIIRLTGGNTIDRFAPLFNRGATLIEAATHTAHYGIMRAPRDRVEIDRVVVLLFRAPRSYTGQDTLEIICHGSPAGIEKTLVALYEQGFRAADPGEFTQRAFLNGKMDLTAAEAIDGVIRSQTAHAHSLALRQLGGAVVDRVDAIKLSLTRLLALTNLHVDYPDDEIDAPEITERDIEPIIAQLDTLIESYRVGSLYKNGLTAVLGGAPNAGKSSLFNLLLRQDRSIVSPTPGTTRDWVDATLSLEGIPLQLYDTAGIRDSSEAVEREGDAEKPLADRQRRPSYLCGR